MLKLLSFKSNLNKSLIQKDGDFISFQRLTVENVDRHAGRIPVRGSADVDALMARVAALYEDHAEEDFRLDLRRNEETGCDVRIQWLSFEEPLNVRRRVRLSGGVAQQSYGTSHFDILCSGKLNG